MKRDARFYWKLFRATFSLSAFTFGGGFVIIPLMRKKFVEDFHWIDEQEILDLTAIAQSSPGAIAVNASILIGYRMAGVLGALVSILGTILPPLIILTVISYFYQAFRSSAVVNALMKGMQAAVAAVIIDVVINMGTLIVKLKKVLPLIMMAAAFIATYFFKVNVVLIILVCALFGVFSTLYEQRKEKMQS